MSKSIPIPTNGQEGPLDLIRRALAGLQYGEVTIAVHDGEVVQIERTEKIRPRAPRP